MVDNKLFAITCSGSIGGTFLDWSIHWLSGENKFYNIDSGWGDLSTNPLTSFNSHNHQKNFVGGYRETSSAIDKLKSILSDNTLSIYADSAKINQVADQLGITKNNISKLLPDVFEYIAEDFKKMWEHCHSNQVPIIYLNLSYPKIYNSEIRTLEGKSFLSGQSYTTVDDVMNNFLNLYFDDADIWLDATAWDKRERAAINLRPFFQPQINKYVDFSIPYLYLDAQELWIDGEFTLQKVMKYLKIDVNPSRLASWIPIYHQWQKIQIKLLRFGWNIDHICDAIVNNHYYDISDYNLDLWHEAIIQHCLLYKYNLNLKSWQLEKFPTNTQDLHKLLESNIIHKLDDIYGLLKDR